jgi:hypothetical protein
MFLFTGKNKHKLRDISLRSGFAASGWSTVVLGTVYTPLYKGGNKGSTSSEGKRCFLR